jgi:hypothetical protein
MIPFHFGRPDRALFGAYHAGSMPSARRAAVLLVNPFGQEAVRIHRFFRVLSDRLARAGISIMRFDPFGTGDSGGADTDGDLDGWCRDVGEAHQELAARSGASHITWLGARLGATLALRASRAGGDVDRLLLWDPVLDGQGYLDLLRDKHVEALELSYGITGPDWRAQLEHDAAAFEAEAIGFGISPLLRSQLAALAPDTLQPPPGIETRLIGSQSDEVLNAWLQTHAAATQASFVALDHDFDWTAEEALNTALVPAQALQLFTTMLQRHD